MKPKDLSARISDLESLLHHFSFEELTMEEATYLKSTFNAFKKSMGNDSLNANNDKVEIPNHIKTEILPALEYLIDCSRLLSTGPLTQEQRAYINGMQQISHMLFEKVQKSSSATGPISSMGAVKELDFNLYHLLRNVLFISRTLLSSPDLKLSIDIDGEIPEIQRGDPSLISHILIHLFGKGINYTDTGSISLRISLLGKTNSASFLEFRFVMRDGSPISDSNTRFQKHELPFKSIQKWMEKHNLRSELIKVSESEQGIKFVLPLQKPDQIASTPQKIQNKSGKFSPVTIALAPSFQTGNWDSLLLECQGDLDVLTERLNRWQGQLLGFVGRTKIQLKKGDFAGIEKSSIEIRDNLEGIPFHDIQSLLQRITRTCMTDRDIVHLRYLYKSLLDEYGNMDRAIVSELKRLQREGRL